MRLIKKLFKRKDGGTRVGNWIRRRISANTYGLSDILGLTDGHRNGGIHNEFGDGGLSGGSNDDDD